MEATVAIVLRTFFVLAVFVAPVLAQAPNSQAEQPEFIKQGQQLMREGKLDEALALYRHTLQISPDSLPANIAAGSVLDLMGSGEEARQYFAKAIQVADTPEHKVMAQRAMAMSYAFEGNCKKTVQYEQQVFDYYGGVKDFFRQGETADEAARVCIDSGDSDTAYDWYKTGHETGLKEPDIKPGSARPVGVPLGTCASPHRCTTWESSRSAEACRCSKGRPRQGNKSRAGTISSVPARLCCVLRRRLQGGARRAAESEPERPIHSMSDGTDLREVRRQGESVGVLPQGFYGNRAQSRRRARCTSR